jgi:gamma-glutamyltranspeptidase / glutathione hydrolase
MTRGFTTRPVFHCREGVVAAGHYLAAAAGHRVFLGGGNAIDAAAAASFALTVVEPHLNGLAGEVPILIHSAREGRVVAISGQGPAPALMTIEHMKTLGLDRVPGDGLLPATVPALVDAWIVALRHYGSRPLAEVLEPAIELAERGWAAQHTLVNALRANATRFREEWPETARVFLPGGEVPAVGSRVCNPDLGKTLRRLAEAAAAAETREAGLEAAHRAFYRGDLAEAMDRHARGAVKDVSGGVHEGLLRKSDLASYRGRVEEPLSVHYRETQVFKCPTWTQGAVFLQQLRLLEHFDLRSKGHNSADTLHALIECAKLAFADREVYYGDPEFADVPLDRLLSVDYAARRAALVDAAQANALLRPGDRPATAVMNVTDILGPGIGEPSAIYGDTTHVDTADAEGNLVAATPSGGWIVSSPLIPGLGFPLGTRGQMVSLDPAHPNALHPGKRPRATLTPSLAYRDGKPWMAFGTPGGDMQDQWTLQFFLNVVEFGMPLQEALDAPTVHTRHFPASFYPRAAVPLRVSAEGRISAEVLDELRRRGHDVVVPGDWEHGRVQAVTWSKDGLAGAASPRRETAYVMGW